MPALPPKKHSIEWRNSEIARVFKSLETFTKAEITKLKKENPYLLHKMEYGYSLGFYKIVEDQGQFIVKTQADDVLGVFDKLLHSVLFSLLLSRNNFNLSNQLLSCSNDLIKNQSEVQLYERKLSDFSKKKTKDWWIYDLYTGKLSESRNKVEIAKIQLSDSVIDAKYTIRHIKGIIQ